MSDTNVKAIDLVNRIKEEVQNTLEQLKALDVNSKEAFRSDGVVVGPTAILLSKTNMLGQLMDLTRGVTVYENIDARVIAMAKAGNDMFKALHELSPKNASGFTDPILKAWDDAVIGGSAR